LKSPADCTNAAVYYKSCPCGDSSKGTAGEATFISGNVTEHIYGTSWKFDKDNHWHECACGDKADTAAHTPKVVNAEEATASEKGYTGDTVCSVCGYEIAKGEDIPVNSTTPKTGYTGNFGCGLSCCLFLLQGWQVSTMT